MGQDGSIDTIVDPTTGNEYDLSGNLLAVGGPQPVITPITSGGGGGGGGSSGGVSMSTPSSSGFNLTNLFNSLTQAAVAGQKIYLTSQQPGLVPGTNAIYNPATGQYYNPTTGQVVNAPGAPGTTSSLFPAGLSTANLGPILLFGGLGIGALVLIHALSSR